MENLLSNWIEEELKNIAEKENGIFSYEEYLVPVGNGVRLPVSRYTITIQFKDSTIEMIHEIGKSDFGKVICQLSKHYELSEFQLSSKSHFENLFYRQKHRFRINSENVNFKDFIKNTFLKHFQRIMKKVNFSPSMNMTSDNKIEMDYHLGIPDWVQIVSPTINFFKDLTNALERNSEFYSDTYSKKRNSYKK